MDSTACRNAFVKAFEKASGKTLNFSSYRQAVQAFAEKHIQLLNNSCMDAVHNQFGHSARTGSIHYGRSQYDIHGMSRDKVSEYMQLSVAWHEVLGIGSPSLSKMSDNAKLPTAPSISALSGSQVIVKLNQTNLVMPSATVSWEAKGYPITQSAPSMDLTSTLIKAIQIMTTFGCSGFKSPEQGRLIAEVMKKDADILGILPTGGGKSMAVFAPVKSDMSVCPELSTILIVPLIGLRDQFIQRAEAYNIPCVLWTPSSQIQPCSAPALIIVAVENAVTACFNNFLRDLVNLSKVARVVIDECHLVSTSSSFRPVFEQLHTVRVGSFPLVLLSATIPPSVEKELSLKFASQFRVIRSSTVNWSRYYTVLLFKKEELFSFLTNSILAKSLSSGSSSLVFVKSLREGERLTNSLTQVGHKAAFYSSQLSSEERLSLVSKLGKQIKVLVATSAFGVGIDSPAFDTVVHYNCAWSLLDYIQECGRSGRNANVSFCYLLKTSELTSGCGDQAMSQYITNTSRCRRSIISEHIDGDSVYCVQNLKGVLCDICEIELSATSADAGASKRKKVRFETDPVKDIKQISQDQMSIKTVRKLTARESLVRLRDQATEKSFRTAVPPKAQLISALMIQDRVKQDIGDLDGTIKLLRTVKDAGCIVCLFNGVQGQYHQLGQCNYMNGYCVRCFGVTHSDERKCVRPLLKKLCFVCAMPSNLGELWRHDKNYGPNCQQGLSDVLIPLAFIVWRTDQRRQMALDELGTRIKFVNLENYQEYWNWLNERSDLNLPNFVRLLKFCVQQKWI
jgi:superfamily II DNA helicase RecQ